MRELKRLIEEAKKNISNGFGSRGIFFAPTVPKQLVEAIYSGKEIPKEINISRFYKDFDEAPFL